MALAGAPRLITQTGTNLRVSTETEAGFVQQASTGLINSVFDGEEIFVLQDRIVARRVEPSGNTFLQLYDLELNLLDTYAAPAGIQFTFSFNPLDAMFVAYAKTGTSGNVRVSLNAERTGFSTGAAPTGLVTGTAAIGIVRSAASPDGSSIVQLNSSGTRRFFNRIDAQQYQQVAPTGVAPIGVGTIIEWTRNSAFILIGLATQVLIYAKLGAAYNYVGAIDMANGTRTVHRVSMSTDNVFLAVSTSEDDGGVTVYRTRLFKRSGEEFMPLVAIDNFGSTLSWNEKGDQLYDAGLRRAFRRTPSTNNFVELAGFMANIPAGVQQSATTLHIAYPAGQAVFYDGTLFDLVTGVQPLAGLKFALLDAAYVFNSSAPNASGIMAAHEVHGAHWPQGGKDLVNVRFEPYGTQGVYLDADDISQVIYEGSITARYALVYDSASDLPLAFVDFQDEVIAELNSKFVLKMGDFGFVLISP